jgi:hypothetical protein
VNDLRLIPLGELADRLHYEGRDRERSVRRCFHLTVCSCSSAVAGLISRPKRCSRATIEDAGMLSIRPRGKVTMRAEQCASAGTSGKLRNIYGLP